MFDFNTHGLQTGSSIVSGTSGQVVYKVLKTLTPEWETPCSDYLNSALWVQVEESTGEQFAQPVQWFNAVIAANEGMTVIK